MLARITSGFRIFPRYTKYYYLRGPHCRKMTSRPQNLMGSNGKQVIVLSGATSAGKSAVAMELCRKVDAEIVVADAVQIYKYLDIGSNKPTAADRIDVPHHMVDLRDPQDSCSSGQFVKEAVPIIRGILSRGKVPIVVGGSTMWLQWLVHGIPDAPPADPESVRLASELMNDYEKSGDWDAAVEFGRQYNDSRIDLLPRNDWYRMRRIYEIGLAKSQLAGKSVSEDMTDDTGRDIEDAVVENEVVGALRTDLLSDLDLRCFFLSENREQLYRTIDHRCDLMIQAGLFREVEHLMSTGKITPTCMGARAIGYQQTIEYLLRGDRKSGDASAYAEFLMNFTTATRNYSKRQLKWFRQDNAFLWLQIFRQSIDGMGNIDPYDRVSEEIIHWCKTDRNAFANLIKNQLLFGQAVTELRTQIRFKKVPVISSYYHELGLRQLQVDKEWNKSILEYDGTGSEQIGKEVGCKLEPKWSAEGISLRASEGTRASQALLEYAPYFQDLSLPDIPDGATAESAAREYCDQWAARESRRLQKRKQKDLKLIKKEGGTSLDESLYILAPAELNDLYAKVLQFYQSIQQADVAAELVSKLPNELLEDYRKKLL